MRLYDLLLRIRRERLREFPRVNTYTTRLYSGVGKATVVILGTEACRRYKHGGCTMCPYPQYKPKRIDVERDFRIALRKIERARPKAVMLYSSGSVLDEREVEFRLLKSFIDSLPESVEEIYIETRPEFVDERLAELERKIIPAIGLETSNDIIRLYHIRKGFTRKMFLEALEKAKRYAFGVKAYVLLKPPMLLEEEAYRDAKKTLEDLDLEAVRVVSLNPVHADPGTLQYELLRRSLREPPSFYTLFRVILDARGFSRRYVLISEPLKAGRGGIRPYRDLETELKILKEAVFAQDYKPIEEYLG